MRACLLRHYVASDSYLCAVKDHKWKTKWKICQIRVLAEHQTLTGEDWTEKRNQSDNKREWEGKTGLQRQQLYISFISDSPNSICPFDKCSMIILVGWFFGRQEKGKETESTRFSICQEELGVNQVAWVRWNIKHKYATSTNNITFRVTL